MGRRILIIEDNEQNRYLITFMLQQAGHEVLQARDGLEGIAMAETEAPELILLDIQLPQMDGYAIAGELKKRPTVTDVPIVAVTSYAMVGDREAALAAGCIGYIEKPINPDTFVGEIEHFLPD